ncbi:MAG: MurR/RpiR family transcriptional regulator [Ancrocorticia sp.]|uniref:MurR/RpiR family transcriptional regulator n=1 Tax=Ancrocorticia sp. TaxID=2593684 RepID=UPI003F8F161E
MSPSLFERLASLDRLTGTEETLAHYFEASYPSLAFQNLETVVQGTGVSATSVTRFVRRLDYADFRDFSASVKSEVEANFDRPLQRGTESIPDGPGMEMVQHFTRATGDIQQTMDTVSTEEFTQIADLLADESRPLFLISVATGRTLLHYFYLLCKYQRGNVHMLSGIDMNSHELVDLTADSVVFATAFDRHPMPVEATLKLARSRGATTILLTNRATSPLRIYSDHVLLVQSDPTPRFKSRATMLLMLESLLAGMEHRHPERTLDRTRLIEEGSDQLNMFIWPDR